MLRNRVNVGLVRGICLWALSGACGAGVLAQPLETVRSIPAAKWACLLPLLGNDCTGGGEAGMLQRAVAPRDVTSDSPHLGDVWSDIDFGGNAASGRWLGEGKDPVWELLAETGDASYLDFDTHLRLRSLPHDDF